MRNIPPTTFRSPRRARRVLTVVVMIALCPLLALASPSAEQQAPTSRAAERDAVQVWDTVMSPYCPGRTLSGCPSEDARKLREEILEWFTKGASTEEVLSRLKTKYGEGITGKPSLEGVGAAGWLMPVVFVALGGVVILLLTARKKVRRGEAKEELAQLEADLKEKLEALERKVKAGNNRPPSPSNEIH